MIRRRAASNSRRYFTLAVTCLCCCSSAFPQVDLDSVLAKMDATASTFRSAQANFTWTMYNAVINDVAETQTGKIYFRRNGNSKETQMAAVITQPEAKRVIFSEGKIQIFQPRLETVDVYDASAHREEFETFLVLGFGSSGQEMRKSFDVTYGGEEKVDGVDGARLELVPKSDKIKQHFPKIILWIDQQGISVQQKLLEPNGDYRLAKYSNIQLNQKTPDDAFRLKASHAKTVNH